MSRPFTVAGFLLILASVAGAQTATTTGILTQGRYCLDLAGEFSPTNPPPFGTRVVAEACSGRPSQRWVQFYGDDDSLFAVGDRLPVLGFEEARGTTVNVGGRETQRSPRYDSDLHIIADSGQERCLTRAERDVYMAPCDGSPAQRWELR
ncbi:MAG: hypothetical protein ACI9KE_001843 [Polyangiales bacterium]|jgi:hypothetical protein